MLGGLLSATDPVAVVAVLKELGTSKKLSTIIEGESLMNDGYAFFQSKHAFLFSCQFCWRNSDYEKKDTTCDSNRYVTSFFFFECSTGPLSSWKNAH